MYFRGYLKSKQSFDFVKRGKIAFFNSFRCCTMDSEEDSIHYSQQKINGLILNSGLRKDDAVLKYIKDCTYPSIQDFKKGLEWFNVSEPLSFSKHLNKKVVVLDFFTYCCINCMHILPDLKELESEFSVEDGLVVIGVHSAKFENEKQSENILSAVQRYNITHPVVNDNTSDMWRKCDVHCWPTLLLLAPNSKPLVMLMGEGHKADLRLYIKNSLAYYKSKNLISSDSLPFKSAFHLLPELKGPLLFPGKITHFNDKIAISDTGNHRILFTDLAGNILYQIGGKFGFKDGNFETCELNSPQGVVFLNENILYVADTENHAIRMVDLKAQLVTTVAGTGNQGNDKKGGKIGVKQTISSPWDLVVYKHEESDVLLIAMAGTHQLWALFPRETFWWKGKTHPAGTCLNIVGSGREENRNNQYPMSAAFAQPSGLAVTSTTTREEDVALYVADSESSSIRRVRMVNGHVTGVVGGELNPNNLFAFGDKDGKSHNAKLQHALGVTLTPDHKHLFVADTYNHKLKIIDLSTDTISTLKINPNDSNCTFNEPAGLTFINNKLYVADTNNHCIKVVEFTDNQNYLVKSVKKLELKSQTLKISTELKHKNFQVLNTGNEVKINTSGGRLIVKLDFNFVQGLKLTEDAPQSWFVDLVNSLWSCTPSNGNNLTTNDLVISIPPKVDQDKDVLDFVYNLVTCTDESCYPKSFIIRQTIVYDENKPATVEATITVNLSPKSINIK